MLGFERTQACVLPRAAWRGLSIGLCNGACNLRQELKAIGTHVPCKKEEWPRVSATLLLGWLLAGVDDMPDCLRAVIGYK